MPVLNGIAQQLAAEFERRARDDEPRAEQRGQRSDSDESGEHSDDEYGGAISRSQVAAGATGAPAPLDLNHVLQRLAEAVGGGGAVAAAGDAGAGGGAATDAMQGLLSAMDLGGIGGRQLPGIDPALLGALLAGGGPADAPAHMPAAPAAVAALPRIPVRDPAVDLPRKCSLRLHGTGAELVALPAGFGPVVPATASGTTARLAAAEPSDAAVAPLRNSASLAGCIVLVDRGAVTFATKVHRAQLAGAVAVVCANSRGAAWPYTPTDSKGEAAGLGLRIPLVMVRHEDGERLRAALAHAAALGHGAAERAEAARTATLAAAPGGDSCPICCEGFEAGSVAVPLPCQHVYHDTCVVPWLQRRHTCPICRAELPVDDAPSGAGAGAAPAALLQMRREAERAAALERERSATAASWYQ